jgi:hypothetical protein
MTLMIALSAIVKPPGMPRHSSGFPAGQAVSTGITIASVRISSFDRKKVWGADAHQRSKEDQTEN